MFGRYEKHNNRTNEHKYYELLALPDGKVEVHWGRVGTRGQKQIVSHAEASTRIRKKRADGYDYVTAETQHKIDSSVMTEPEIQKEDNSGFSFSSWLGD